MLSIRTVTRRRHYRLAVPVLLVALSACAGTPAATSGPTPATEAEWRALRAPRPDPLPGAARVSVAAVEFLGAYPWSYGGSVGADLGIAELAIAGLLGRRDVHFVERRRFSAASAAERSRLPRPAGRPPVGVSTGAEFAANAVYAPLTEELASLEIRLVELQTGDVAGATRVQVPVGGDPVRMGRAMVDGILEILDEMDRLPVWEDPRATTGANASGETRVGSEAIANFLRGLAYEEVWRWEYAREAYQAAARADFPEADAAVARTARLRLGGTLAES